MNICSPLISLPRLLGGLKYSYLFIQITTNIYFSLLVQGLTLLFQKSYCIQLVSYLKILFVCFREIVYRQKVKIWSLSIECLQITKCLWTTGERDVLFFKGALVIITHYILLVLLRNKMTAVCLNKSFFGNYVKPISPGDAASDNLYRFKKRSALKFRTHTQEGDRCKENHLKMKFFISFQSISSKDIMRPGFQSTLKMQQQCFMTV